MIASPPTTVTSCTGTPYDQPVENPLADIDTIDQIEDLAERAREIGRRLNQIPTWNDLLRKKRQAVVLLMREGGMSYAEIGRQIGLHRNRVQQIAEGRPGGGQGGRSEAEA